MKNECFRCLSTRFFLPLACFSALAIFSFSGCGKGYPGDEKLYPVAVTITESGKPVEGAIVILDRQSGTKVNSSGLTNSQGIAEIMIDAEWKGAPQGTYMVRISKEPPFTPDLTNEEYAQLPLNKQEDYNNRMLAKRKQLKPIIPPVLSGGVSPLKMEVSAGKNAETFDIAEHW